MEGHERPVLIRPVNQTVDQVGVRYRLRRPVHELEVLQRLFRAVDVPDARRLRLEVVLLHEEWHERRVVEVHLHLVAERLARGREEHPWPQDLVDDGEGRHDRVFLVGLDTAGMSATQVERGLT